MPEGLTTADGAPVDAAPVGGTGDEWAEFKVAQAAAADTGTAPAPPKRAPDAEGAAKRPRGRPRKDAAEKPRVAPAKTTAAPKDYTPELTGVVQLLWGITAPLAPADAAAFKLHGPGVVSAWNALAQENAQVAKGIEWLTTGSTYGAVVMATTPLILQLLTNHKVLPHERVATLGVHDPAALAEMTHSDVQAAAEYAQAMAEQAAA